MEITVIWPIKILQNCRYEVSLFTFRDLAPLIFYLLIVSDVDSESMGSADSEASDQEQPDIENRKKLIRKRSSFEKSPSQRKRSDQHVLIDGKMRFLYLATLSLLFPPYIKNLHKRAWNFLPNLPKSAWMPSFHSFHFIL